MDTAVIQTVGMHKDFGRVKALDGLALEVLAGEIRGFLGPNGARKTTTPPIGEAVSETRRDGPTCRRRHRDAERAGI